MNDYLEMGYQYLAALVGLGSVCYNYSLAPLITMGCIMLIGRIALEEKEWKQE